MKETICWTAMAPDANTPNSATPTRLRDKWGKTFDIAEDQPDLVVDVPPRQHTLPGTPLGYMTPASVPGLRRPWTGHVF